MFSLKKFFFFSLIGGWDADQPVDPSPNALGNVLHFDYDHIGCCSKVAEGVESFYDKTTMN